MQYYLDQEAIKEIETKYDLGAMGGGSEPEVETARQIRARSVAAYEDYLREAYALGVRALQHKPQELEEAVTEQTRGVAHNVFPYPDAYIIQLQLTLSRGAAMGVIPLSDDQLTDIYNPAAEAAWGEIATREYEYRLPSIRIKTPGGQAAEEVLRIKRITEIPENGNRFNRVRVRFSGMRQNRNTNN